MLLPALLSIALVFSLILPASAAGASEIVPGPNDRSISHLTVDSASATPSIGLNTPQGNVTPMIAAGQAHTVGLKSDGTVVAVGANDEEQCEVGGWSDITQVAAGQSYTVGLKSDGALVAVGSNYYGQCEFSGWTDITYVAAGSAHTVGLKSDGTVVAVVRNSSGQCEVGGWMDITRVAAGGEHTVGLKSDGTVVAVGSNGSGQCEVGGWTDITHIAAGYYHTVGLKADGTVVAVGSNSSGQCDVGDWTDIVKIAAGASHTVGLKSDGTLVAVGSNSSKQCDVGGWMDITYISAGHYHTVGLKSDGTLVAVGYNSSGQCDVGGWNLVLALPPSVPPSQEVQVGVKAGDWIKVEYKITGWPSNQTYPEWFELEFLSVEGTTANVQATMHMSDGTEQSDTVPLEVATGGGEAFGLSGFVISANLTKGDSFYMSGYGNVAIEGETTRTYAGALRTVVYTSFSQYVAQFTYYWDKLTGVLVEASIIYGDYTDITATAKAIETNMWEAGPPDVGMPWWPWIIVAVVAVGLVIFFVRRRGRVPADTSG
jgi:hypothetical protein